MQAAHGEDASELGAGSRREGNGRGAAAAAFLAEVHLDAGDGSGRGTVTLQGELDLATKPIAEKAVRRAERLADLVVLDLRGVSFMDSSGLHLVIDTNFRQREAGRRLVVITGSPQVRRILELTGVAEQLEISEQMTTAEATPAVSDAH